MVHFMKKKLSIAGIAATLLVVICGFGYQTAPLLSAAYRPNSFSTG